MSKAKKTKYLDCPKTQKKFSSRLFFKATRDPANLIKSELQRKTKFLCLQVHFESLKGEIPVSFLIEHKECKLSIQISFYHELNKFSECCDF